MISKSLIIVAAFAAVVLISIWNGYALSVLWEWFVVHQFKVEPISIPVAIGLSMIVSYLTYQFDAKNENGNSTEEFIKSIAIGVLKPAFALLFGWIVTLFL